MNALNELHSSELDCVAALVNATKDNAGFRLAMREIPALGAEAKLGDYAIAYLEHVLKGAYARKILRDERNLVNA